MCFLLCGKNNYRWHYKIHECSLESTLQLCSTLNLRPFRKFPVVPLSAIANESEGIDVKENQSDP